MSANLKRSAALRVLEIEPLQLPADYAFKAGVPATRADCANEHRPCQRIACRHNNWLRLSEEQPGNPQRGRRGSTTLRASTMNSCSLDVADRGPMTFKQVGHELGIHASRARQIALLALFKMFIRMKRLGLDVTDVRAMLEQVKGS